MTITTDVRATVRELQHTSRRRTSRPAPHLAEQLPCAGHVHLPRCRVGDDHRLHERVRPADVEDRPLQGCDRQPVDDDDLGRGQGVRSDVHEPAAATAPAPPRSRDLDPIERQPPDRQAVQDGGRHVTHDRLARQVPHRRPHLQPVVVERVVR